MRYDSVIAMMEGMKTPKNIIRRVKKLIEEDEKHLTIKKEKGKVFMVDKRTGKKI